MAFSEEELKETQQGAKPYTSEQNEEIETKKQRVTPQSQEKPQGNGFKYYRKCPTCGQMQEMGGNKPIASVLPNNPQIAQSHPLNPYIRPFPMNKPQHTGRDRIISDEKDEQGKPLVEAGWNESTGRIPLR